MAAQVELLPVDHDSDTHHLLLYSLLSERRPEESISHKVMPSYEQHCDFVRSRPYRAWYLIKAVSDLTVGAIYLSEQNEIGVFIATLDQGRGFGSAAVRALLKLHPGIRALANINPANVRSQRMFKRLGFKLIQHTYALEP